MVFTLRQPAKELTAKQIKQIFEAANECYQFRLDARGMERALNYLTHQGISLLRKRTPIDYRPFMGAKFFIQPLGDETRIWAYSRDKPQPEEEEKLDKRLEQMFS